MAGGRLYVFNLPWRVTRRELWFEFGRHGKVVDVYMPRDKTSRGRNTGHAFVEMENEEQAADAFDALDGKSMRGRNIRVAPATERQPKPDTQ